MRRFTIAGLMILVAVVAVLIGAIVESRTEHHLNARFASMPPDDSKLADWFRKQDGIENLSITREADRLHISFRKRDKSFNIITPPYEELGYAGLSEGGGYVSVPSLVKSVVDRFVYRPWWALIILAVLGWFFYRSNKSKAPAA